MSRPIWEIFVDGTDTSVNWIDHAPNRRFAIYNAGGSPSPNDDLVWDKATGLIWPRNANLSGTTVDWWEANASCRRFQFAFRRGWRLPTIEELSSLVDTRHSSPALPTGHPFVSVHNDDDDRIGYWSSTNSESAEASPGDNRAWFIFFSTGTPGQQYKEEPDGRKNPGYVWPVYGGRGGVNWR